MRTLLPILSGVLSDKVDVLAMTCSGDHKTPVAVGLPSTLTHTTDLAVHQPVSKLPVFIVVALRAFGYHLLAPERAWLLPRPAVLHGLSVCIGCTAKQQCLPSTAACDLAGTWRRHGNQLG